MFEQMMRRVEAGAGEAVRMRAAAIADAVRWAVQGAGVEVDGGRVTVRARGLMRRWLDQAALRVAGFVR